MKTLSSLLLIFICFNSLASNDDLKRLINDRKQLELSYNKLQDSVIPGRLIKMYLLNEQLVKITLKDDSIINFANSLINREERYLDSIKQIKTSLAQTSFDNIRLQERTVNDLKMILILKVAVSILLVVILILIYFLITTKRKVDGNRNLQEEISGLESLNISLKKEIDLHRVRENQFKNDLERSIKSEQERYNVLNESYNQLLAESQQSKLSSKNHNEESSQEYIAQINQLKRDNEQFVKRISSLQLQLEESTIRNQSILKKINKLITDLSGVS